MQIKASHKEALEEMPIKVIFRNHQLPGTGDTNDFQSDQGSSLDMVAAKTSTWNFDRQFSGN